MSGGYKYRVWWHAEDEVWYGQIVAMPKYTTSSEDGSLNGAIEWCEYLLDDLRQFAEDGFFEPLPPPDLPEGVSWIIVDFGGAA